MAPFDTEVLSSTVCAVVSAPIGSADRIFGLAVFDQERRTFQICEFSEDVHAARSEALLLQLMPRKLVSALSDPEDTKRLAGVADSCGVPLEEVKAFEASKQVDLEQDLTRLLKDTAEVGLQRHLEEQRRKHGMRALAVLIGHFSLISEAANTGSCTLGMYALSDFVYMDKAAFSALNVLPRPEESMRSNSSLLGFLNRCRSPIGQRRLREWVTQPLTSAADISARHDVVEALSRADGLLRQLEGLMRRIPDLERLAARFHRVPTASKGQKASLEDLVLVYQATRVAEQVLLALNTYEGVHAESLKCKITEKVGGCLTDLLNFKALVEQIVDLEQAEQRNYCISKAFDAHLGTLADQRDAVRVQMEQVRDVVDAALGIQERGNHKVVSLCEAANDGRAFRVTKKHQQAIQHFKGQPSLKVLQLKKMEVVFTTPDLVKLNAHFKETSAAYDKQSAQLVQKALTVAATYSAVIDRLGDVLASLDVLSSFARVVLTAPCTFVRPEVESEGNKFHIEGASHILVVANSDKSFVANDLDMERESCRLHIITGPNMGGKSTYIRSIALIAMMNQIGSFVPCRSAKLPIFDAIMCRVGASDMQLRGISTFMAEMLEASCILRTATDRTLVIVDELGRGTSTSDGFGIAWAIAQQLVSRTRCYSLFATHFHELAALAEAAQGVKNRHATATVDAVSGQLTFLYALADGSADQSYGAHVAEIAGFPAHVVERAKIKAAELEASSGCSLESPAERAIKRARLGEPTPEGDPLGFLGAAIDAEDFANRALRCVDGLKSFLQCAAAPKVVAVQA